MKTQLQIIENNLNEYGACDITLEEFKYLKNQIREDTIDECKEEFEKILKQMYLEVANSVNGNMYTSKNDLVSIVCGKCRLKALELLENNAVYSKTANLEEQQKHV